MPLAEFLKSRKERAEARASQPQEDAAKKAQLMQDINQKAQVVRELLANPSYAVYATMLSEAEAAFQAQLNAFDGTFQNGSSLHDASTLIRLGRLQGYLELLSMIRRMPETLLALAEQRESPEGNGRHPLPHATHPDASTAR